jgi:hypothetical protein
MLLAGLVVQPAASDPCEQFARQYRVLWCRYSWWVEPRNASAKLLHRTCLSIGRVRRESLRRECMHSQSSGATRTTATSSSSTASSTPAHASTSPISPVLAPLMRPASTTAVCLVLDLLFLDHVDNFIGHSEVFDLQNVSAKNGRMVVLYALCCRAHRSPVIA